ncbi:MAG: hypothetical protein QOG63_2033 [Thermoleophilaceae bacterium]|nr:hypothetical protein [Thermoleophilaceae bacterium]
MESQEEPQRGHVSRLARGLGPLIPPILLAAYPLLSLFEQNQTDLPVGVIWSPLAVTVVAILVLYGVLVLVFRSGLKAGALTSLCVVVFFYWGTFKADLSGLHISDGVLLAVWLVLFLAGVVLLVRTKRSLVTLALGLGVLAAVLAVVPFVKIASYQADNPAVRSTDSRLWSAPLPEPAAPTGARPDVYVIIPDDYARSDVLNKYFHYDNSAFIRQLNQRGFVVSDQARSPYSDSESNIAAELNMDYLNGLGKILGQKSEDVRPLKTLIEDNRASRLLKQLRYRYVHIDSDEVTYAAGNPGISSVATPDSFTSLWLQKSVLAMVGGSFGFTTSAANDRFRDSVHSAFAELAATAGDPGPKFVVFHTLMPHDPYIFGARGEPVTFPDNSDTGHGTKLGMTYYLRQLRYIETQLLASVDAIQKGSKVPPVIVIQSDEGFEANPENFGEATMQDIRVKGLTAISLPGVSGVRAPSPPTTVNTLRYVFNRSFGTHYPMLRAASYPEGDFPYQFQEMRVR